MTFEYTFDGERHTASNVEPPSAGAEQTHRYPSESGARAHFDHEAGDTVTAHVDPARPGEGFLEPATGTTRDLALLIGGGAMVVLGVTFAVTSVVVLRGGGPPWRDAGVSRDSRPSRPAVRLMS